MQFILDSKCVGFRARSVEVKTNLCSALVDEKQDVVQMINVFVTVKARESERRYYTEGKEQ